MTTSTDLDLYGVADVADLFGVSRRTVEDWIASGRLVPEATVARRLLWREATVLAWDDAGRPAGELPDAGEGPMPELVGTDYVAKATGRKQRTIFSWNSAGRLPAVDFEVSFSALIWRRETIDRWLEECSNAAPA